MSPRNLIYLICGLCILLVYAIFTSAPTHEVDASGQHLEYPLGATPSPTLLCGPTFQIVDSPNASVDNNSLYDVLSLSESNAWAVGGTEDVGGLIEHWDGGDWTIVPNGALGYLSTFYSVAAVASNDIWTVGSSNNGALAYRWDGGQWSSFSVPSQYGTLYGVAAVSANDVWAVGDYATNGVHAYVVHWNGSAWSEVPIPSVGTGASYLKDVAAISANDVWAVGYYYDPEPSSAHCFTGMARIGAQLLDLTRTIP